MLAGLACLFILNFVPSAPKGIHGKLNAATVTMRYFSETATNSDGRSILEKTVFIREPARLAALEQSLKRVPNNYSANSMEGMPRYSLQVQYTDGRTQSFYFTRTEFGLSGATPPSLLEELKRDGL